MNVLGQTADTPQTTPQNQQKNQNTDEITAVPNRPTFASTAEMVQLGVFEIEYGFEAGKGHHNVNGLLKWGAVKNLELWFLNNPIERDAGTAGLGDSGAGFKYKLFPQVKARPTVAILYVATLPTARPELGAGAMAHLVQFLVSKDFGKQHFDVNEGVQFVGRAQLSGLDRRYFTALSYSRSLKGKWGYTGEIAGFSRRNATTPANDDAAERRDVQHVAPIGVGWRSIHRRIRTIATVYSICRRHLFHRKSIRLAFDTPGFEELAVNLPRRVKHRSACES